MGSLRTCLDWWRETRNLTREEISARLHAPVWLDEDKRRCARRYLALTNPPIVAALIGATAAIIVAIVAVALK
jgi:hypothetical protein